jgi:hypothetical protein
VKAEPLKFKQWKERLDRAVEEHEHASTLSSEAHQRYLALRGTLMLQFTLPSGTRTTIDVIDLVERKRGQRVQITAANEEGFLTLGMLSIADLEVFLDIRRMIDRWVKGEGELLLPDFPFAPWPK